jgi:nucleoside diphosphate kinase
MAATIIIILKIITPRTGKPTSLRELITDMPIVVKIYDISFRLKFLVRNLRIANTAKRPTAIPNSIKTDFSIDVMKKTVIPIRKNVKRNFSFLVYLK